MNQADIRRIESALSKQIYKSECWKCGRWSRIVSKRRCEHCDEPAVELQNNPYRRYVNPIN